LVYKKILEVLPEGRDDTTGPEKMDQAFLLRFAETTEIRIFYTYFFKKIIGRQSSMQKFELKYNNKFCRFCTRARKVIGGFEKRAPGLFSPQLHCCWYKILRNIAKCFPLFMLPERKSKCLVKKQQINIRREIRDHGFFSTRTRSNLKQKEQN